MDVLCFPSYREGLPNVPVEAQYCGVPVVGYAATGTVDVVLDEDQLVSVGDVSTLASRLMSTVESASLGTTAADRRADRVRVAFSRQSVWDALLRVYQEP